MWWCSGRSCMICMLSLDMRLSLLNCCLVILIWFIWLMVVFLLMVVFMCLSFGLWSDRVKFLFLLIGFVLLVMILLC